jgi:arylsulfatase A-like enzyme
MKTLGLIASIRHRLIPACLAALALCAGCGGGEAPNIILITIDTARADHFSCYGYPILTSPHIDRLAEGGVRCDFVIAQSSITPVSCASQLTGTYPYRHGLRALHGHEKTTMAEGVTSLPEAMKSLGYRTAGFVSAYPATSRYGFAKGFDLFDEAFLDYRRKAYINEAGKVHTGRSQRTAAETNERVIPWIRQNAVEKFFLWIHYFDPHDTNFTPPDEVVRPFLRAEASEDREEYLRSVYDAEIFFTDMQIGGIVKTLEDLEIRDKTILIITSDHGEGLGDHGWWAHGILFQEQIRVPLILNGPGIRQNAVLRSMVEHVDIFPTILDLAEPGSQDGVKTMQGKSFRPLLERDGAPHKTHGYSEVHNLLAIEDSAAKRSRGVMFSLIKGPWKLIHYPLNPTYDQLYNLEKDPREKRNIIAANRSTAAALLAELESREAMTGYRAKTPDLSDEDYRHLKSLGYID